MRPTLDDSNPSKRRILDVAADEFAKKGYDGARVDEIARRCRVSKNLIYHYFDGKEALFIAVLERAYASLRERQQALRLEASAPLEGVSRLIVDTFKYWSNSKDFIAYLNSENYYNAKHIRKSKAIRDAYPALIESIRDLLQRGEKEGLFRPGVDPIELYISISALAYHFFSNQATFSVIFGKDFRGRDVISRRLEHIEDVILGYLQFRPGARSHGGRPRRAASERRTKVTRSAEPPEQP
ncbi:MAG: TetR family transcriptional regulator [Hyphomicrobiales bacterium]|nr:TetR family transcriptional regulator [Hyphomicrobiales bacterium]